MEIKYGRLTILEDGIIDENYVNYCWCKCSCGKNKLISLKSLKKGLTKSCGCIKREQMKDFFKTHGLSKTKFYRHWRSMIQRCQNETQDSYHLYGGRNIKICDRWNKFENFYEDTYKNFQKHTKIFGENQTSLDRIDSNKGYNKENCKWSTQKEQSNNRRSNRLITYNGQTKTIAQWSELTNLKYTTLWTRLFSYNWSVKKAFNTN